MTNEELWQAVLAQIQFNISQASFATWFKNTSILSRKDGDVIISVPNNFSKEWLKNKYNHLILKILKTFDENIKEINYEISGSGLKEKKPVLIRFQETDQLELLDLEIDRETNLHPRYQFNNFVVGPFNELAHAAATAVARNPGEVYNPLFIYGGVGLGKTHLLQAVGNQIFNDFPEKKVKYLPSEKLISNIVTAIRNHSIEKLKNFYKDTDVLIIDDVQFLAGKEKTQEEFFHIFNALYAENKQIVLSSDRPPKAISALEERLKSRFEGGMIADISLPDFETRIAILKMKAQEKQVDFPKEIYEYVASQAQRNIRELEGALNILAAYQRLNNRSPDLEITKTLLKNVVFSPIKTTTPEKIIRAVSLFYDLNPKDLLSSVRKKEIVYPRQIAMYLLREELKSSFPFIGKKFGGKDHTTAIYSYEKIKKEVLSNESLREEINLIKQKIYAI